VKLIRADDVATAHASLVALLTESGAARESRLGSVIELGTVGIELAKPRRCLPGGDEGGTGRGALAARLAQILGGYCDPGAVVHHDPSLAARVAVGGYDGGYGPVIDGQVEPLAAHLRAEPCTRRGMLWLADGPRYFTDRDFPTVLGIQFRIAADRLDATVYTRSLDFESSLQIDCGIFAAIHSLMARELNLRIATLTIVAGSCHAYIANLQTATINSAAGDLPDVDVPYEFLKQDLAELRQVERQLRASCVSAVGLLEPQWEPQSQFARWLFQTLLASHRSHQSR
jgi:hypothetical protein